MPIPVLLIIGVTVGSELSWALLLVVSRVLMLRLEYDPWSFSFVQLCAGGIVLLLLGGRSRFDFTSFLRPPTWILGILRVLSAASFTAVLVWVSVLEAGILAAINVPMVAVAVWFVFGRRPARGEWLGHAVILVPIPFLIAGLDGGIWHPVVGLMLFNEICLVASIIVAERHPDNTSTAPGARLRFTGAVMLVTALFFLVATGGQSGFESATFDGTLLLGGALVGVFLRAPAMFLSFWSIRLVGAQNYMTFIAFLPLTGMVMEEIAFAAGLINVTRIEMDIVLLSLIILAGNFVVLMMRRRAAHKA